MISKNVRLVNKKINEIDLTEEDLKNAPDGFFNEIAVINVLESSEDKNILDMVCNKVRKNGKVILSGVDALEICRQIYYGDLSLFEASDQFFHIANNLNSASSLKKYFLEKKWKINFVGIKNGIYSLEATRI